MFSKLTASLSQTTAKAKEKTQGKKAAAREPGVAHVFYTLFPDVGRRDNVVADVEAQALSGDSTLDGRVFLTAGALCFYADVGGGSEPIRVIVALASVAAVEECVAMFPAAAADGTPALPMLQPGHEVPGVRAGRTFPDAVRVYADGVMHQFLRVQPDFHVFSSLLQLLVGFARSSAAGPQAAEAPPPPVSDAPPSYDAASAPEPKAHAPQATAPPHQQPRYYGDPAPGQSNYY